MSMLRRTLLPAHRLPASAPGEPFGSAEEAFLWAMAALVARRDGLRGRTGGITRPCEPDDVILCLDQLYGRRRLRPDHAHALRRGAERGGAPDPADADAPLWREALERLEWLLTGKGIVLRPVR